MESHKLAFKLFAEEGASLPIEGYIPVLQRWIQGKLIDGHQLIDVANYAHVHEGPGVVLVSHEANIHVDLGDGKLGLMYIRKQPGAGSTFQQRLRTIFGFALEAASLLEADPALAGKLKFRTDNPLFLINDRLNAPNTPETFASVKLDLESSLASICNSPVTLSYQPHAERLFQVAISAPKTALKTLLDRAKAAKN